MVEWIIIILGLAGIIWASWISYKKSFAHGIPRFFAFCAILALIVFQVRIWFFQPFSWHQCLSWLLLLGSIFMALHGFFLLRQIGKPQETFEATSRLVQTGAYHYIRHPLYTSLLLLNWGAFFKQPGWMAIGLALFASICLYITAKIEERENIQRFGDEYQEYMKKTRMFIPGIF